MAQHFLLSSKAATLGLAEVARLSEEEAYETFLRLRYEENDGAPNCPGCGSLDICQYTCRRIFKCKDCAKQFSPTSGTPFAHRKMSMRDILLAIAIFMNSVKGHAALQLRRELKCSYKTAFVLEHKLREVLGTMQEQRKLTGIVEVDGVSIGGHVKKTNLVKDRLPYGFRNDRRHFIVTMRERRAGGRSRTFVCKEEADAIPAILALVHESANIRTDEGAHWNILKGYFASLKKVNHTRAGYSVNGVHTNWVESFNSRIRRAERGIHHHLSGPYLGAYANEIAWREDNRRVSNGIQFTLLAGRAAQQPVSRKWKGYWQRHLATSESA